MKEDVESWCAAMAVPLDKYMVKSNGRWPDLNDYWREKKIECEKWKAAPPAGGAGRRVRKKKRRLGEEDEQGLEAVVVTQQSQQEKTKKAFRVDRRESRVDDGDVRDGFRPPKSKRG